MPVFIVAYDLNRPGQAHDRIASHLQTYQHCHAQGSVWFVQGPGTTSDLRAALLPFLDTNDKLFVDEVSHSWVGWQMPVCGKWLNNHGY